MPGPGMKRKQLRQLTLTTTFKKRNIEGEMEEGNLNARKSADSQMVTRSPIIDLTGGGDEDSSVTTPHSVNEDSDEPLGAMSATLPLDDSPLSEDGEHIEDDGGISDAPSKSGAQRQSCPWKGQPISDLQSVYTLPGPLIPSANHTVMFRPHIDPARPPRPFPDSYRDINDDEHIWMPCSPRINITVPGEGQNPNPRRRWDVIEGTLRKPMSTVGDIQEAICSYNRNVASSWRFETLHSLLHEEMSAVETNNFFETLLPLIVKAALNLPNIVTASIPLLRTGRTHSISFSQQQIVSLLANAFFCTFKHRPNRGNDVPGVNFNRLFCAPVSTRKFEKLRTIFHYFRRTLLDNMPCGTVTFTRRCINNEQLPNWSRSDAKLPSLLHVASEGFIEDLGVNMLQVDFANKRVGGGVLGNGSVQEEIRFVICPELIISRLFTETLEKNEALVIVGAERFSKYSGYANSYAWAGDYVDITPRDAWGRRMTCLVAIDATRFNRSEDQFVPAALKRELDKAYVGFEWSQLPRTVATGNWGCGAFRGSHELKALLQLMACGAAECACCYFTFGDDALCDGIFEIHQLLVRRGKTVKDVWRLICLYWKARKDKDAELRRMKKSERSAQSTETLYNFIHRTVFAEPEDDYSDVEL